MTELLKRLPREPSTLEAVGQALVDAAQVRYGNDMLSALMKDGSMGLAIAKRVRAIDLGQDVEPSERHFEFVKWFILAHYPARIAKIGELYQLAEPTNTDNVEIFKQVVRCYIKHRYSDIDPDTPDDSDLTPPPAVDPFEPEKERAREMKTQGKSRNIIAREVGMSPRWVSKATQDVVKPDPKAELKAKAGRMRSDGLSLEQITDMLNVPTSTIHRWLSDRSHFGHANSNINTLMEKSVPKMGSIPRWNQEAQNRPPPTAIGQAIAVLARLKANTEQLQKQGETFVHAIDKRFEQVNHRFTGMNQRLLEVKCDNSTRTTLTT